MFTEFKHTLRRMRGQIIGWSISLFLYDALMSWFYSSIEEMGEQFQELLELYPPEMMAFFPEMTDIASPTGYLNLYFFGFMTLIIGFFAVNAGAKLLVGHEEQGVLDILMSYPVSRAGLFWGRVLGFITATVIILAASWLGWVLPSESSGLDFSLVEFFMVFVPLFGLLFVFGGLSLLLSMLLPSGKVTNGVASGLLVGNFLLDGMANVNVDLKPLYEITPFYFTQGADVIENFNANWFYGLVGAGLLLMIVPWALFERRDISVGGEGGWRLPSWMLMGAKAK